MRLTGEVRKVFIFSKGNYYGLTVDGMQKRTDIKVCGMLLFPREQHRIKNKMKESKSMKRALKVAKCMIEKMGTVQLKELFNRPKGFHLGCDFPTNPSLLHGLSILDNKYILDK